LYIANKKTTAAVVEKKAREGHQTERASLSLSLTAPVSHGLLTLSNSIFSCSDTVLLWLTIGTGLHRKSLFKWQAADFDWAE